MDKDQVAFAPISPLAFIPIVQRCGSPGAGLFWRSGGADCWTISFFEEVAVRAGSFKPKRFFISCINQDPVGFNVAVA